MPKLVGVLALENYKLDLTFDDGVRGIADLSGLAGHGVFAKWNDYKAFKKVRIVETGELAWDEDVDLCPDSLYLMVTGKNPEDIFPNLKPEPTHA